MAITSLSEPSWPDDAAEALAMMIDDQTINQAGNLAAMEPEERGGNNRTKA